MSMKVFAGMDEELPVHDPRRERRDSDDERWVRWIPLIIAFVSIGFLAVQYLIFAFAL